jgi:hypothetical protein
VGSGDRQLFQFRRRFPRHSDRSPIMRARPLNPWAKSLLLLLLAVLMVVLVLVVFALA